MLGVDVRDKKLFGAKREGAVAPFAAKGEEIGEGREVKVLRERLLLVSVRLLRKCW